MTTTYPTRVIMSEFKIIEDYVQRERSKDTRHLHHTIRGRLPGGETGQNISSKVCELPTPSELKASMQDRNFNELSEGLVSLREKEWSPDETAEVLLKDPKVQEKFANKEELVSILETLKKLDDDLHKIGCSSLRQFLSDLIPEQEISLDDNDNIESSWVPISQHPVTPAKPYFAWRVIKGGYRYALKLSEVKGTISSVIAVYMLLRDPRVILVLKGMKWLLLGLL